MEPLRREEHPELEPLFAHYEQTLSFVPNSLFTMARRPEILGAFSELITQIWDFERSPLYDDAERAALRFARDASLVPNEVTPAHFDDLRRYWDDGQIVEMLSVVGLFGFLNRWNDTMATQLEDEPASFASERYGERWEPGKHAG